MKILSTSAVAFAMLLVVQPVAAQDTGINSVEDAVNDLISKMVPANARRCEVTSDDAYMECLGFKGKSVVTPVKARPDGGMAPITDGGFAKKVPLRRGFMKDQANKEVADINPSYPIQCNPSEAIAFVQFDFASAAIKPRDMQNLWRLADIATHIDLAGCDIRLGGHADAYGSAQANMVLSDKRAKAAQDVMAMAGIDPARIWAKGYGETRLHPDYHREPTHRIHRRVELVFVPRN